MPPIDPLAPVLEAPAAVLSPDEVDAIKALMQAHDADYRQTELGPGDEAKFQRAVRASGWYKGFVATFGGPPNLDDPSYDYRGAWQALGERLPARGEHWPSRRGDQPDGGAWLKSPEHPTSWMEYYSAVTGRDPAAITRQQYDGALGLPEWNQMETLSAPTAEAAAQGYGRKSPDGAQQPMPLDAFLGDLLKAPPPAAEPGVPPVAPVGPEPMPDAGAPPPEVPPLPAPPAAEPEP